MSTSIQMVRSLSPVVDNHLLLNVFDEHLLSADKSYSVSGGVHEVEVQGEDFDTELRSGVGANALLGGLEIVNDPHVLLNVSDVGSLVEVSGKVGIEVHF